MSRVIVHLDADAFFASVEQAADPWLRGKPIAVGGERRGIVASASYEARKFGVYTPMPTARARKLCPKLIVVPGDYERYEQFSNWMFGYCLDFTPEVEQTSIDEGYFDLTANRRKPPVEIAQTVQRAIQQSLKISVSEGLGANKLVSQIASKLNKPAAFLEVPPGHEIQFLDPLPNKWLPGVGPKTAARLDSAGLAQIRHIAATPLEMLELVLGNQARQLLQFAHGVDDRPLIPAREPQKTFNQQQTFGEDLTDEEYLHAALCRMADNLFAKVREDASSIRTLTVKVRYNDMAEDQCSESLQEPTDLETDVYTRLGAMLKSAWKRRVSLRLVSLKLSNVYLGVFRSELPLEVGARRREANEKLARVVDDLRHAKGNDVVLRGHDFRLRDAPREEAVQKGSVRPIRLQLVTRSRAARAKYVPLRAHSHYSFLDSTLSPQAIVSLAANYECPAVALTDTGNLHGAATFVAEVQKAGIHPILGAELRYDDRPLLLYVESKQGYTNLCRLLSRHSCQSNPDDGSVAAQQRRSFTFREFDGLTGGLIAVAYDAKLAELFAGRFYYAAHREASGDLLPTVACPAIHHGTHEDRNRYDIVQSIRTLTLLRQAHPEKQVGGKRHFRTPTEMFAGCDGHQDWLERTREIADRCKFDFPFGTPQFPAFAPPDGSTGREFLRRLAVDGLRRRYRGRRIVNDTGSAVPLSQVQSQLETELSIIAEVGYEDLFLITWDLLQTCRQRGIEWITRGSAADSLVCYCLGISDVCPIRFGLYFRRFLNKERMALHKLPDIDVDFPHDQKDEVVNLLFDKYGPEHCAVVGGFSTFQARSAVADVAKVLGVSEFQIRRFTERFPWSFGSGLEDEDDLVGNRLIERLKAMPECRDLPLEEELFKTAVEMAAFLDGFPRHPKMHPCGVVLSRQPMHELTPTFVSNKGWPTTHFDMDAVEAVGLVKMDILAQGGLAVMRDATQSLSAARGISTDLGGLEPWQDPEIWEMIAGGGSRAVHHIESPAMVGLCRQSNVREIDGLIAIVSVIRPGAANEQKKQKFTRRYQGMEPPEYPHPSLELCLRSTFGLVVYEEHILQICESFAGLNPGRADVLRRALAKQNWKVIREIGLEFLQSATARGHDHAKIQEVWELVVGFNGYAFCKAHSTAYGVEAYQAAWLKCYYPAEFMAGVLTNGKGFYHPLVYVLECHRLGIGLLPPSVNQPGPGFRVESGKIRVPLVRAKGLTQRTTDRMIAQRERGTFTSLTDFYRRVGAQSDEMEIMIRVGACDEFGQTRTAQFWEGQQVQRAYGQLTDNQGWLLPASSAHQLPTIPLVEPTRMQRLQWETDYFDFAVSGHPLELHSDIAWETYCPVSRMRDHVGEEIVACGLIVEQRMHNQVTGEPMKFLTLADWTGMVETELFAATYRTYGLATVRYPVLEITARVEPFENGRGYTLRVLRAAKPRVRAQAID
jgi:DNA-directed DNA polymerase III PolC